MGGGALSGAAFAATIGSLAPHDAPSSSNTQRSQQWVTDPLTKCVAADPDFDPDDSISWQGACHASMVNGPGTLTFLGKGRVLEAITGAFTDGLLQPGRVVATWSDGAKYEGDQLGGLFNGAGKFVSAKGDTLDGEWKFGVLNGKATVLWSNGDRYEGEWKNGKSDGEGVEVWANGHRYEGEWRDGMPVAGDAANAASDVRPASVPDGVSAGAEAAAHPLAERTAPSEPPPRPAIMSANFVPPVNKSTAPAAAVANTATAGIDDNRGEGPITAIPLRSLLGTQLVAVDGAMLQLGAVDDGFERILILPNGNSQQTEFAFANGPVGTVSETNRAIGVFRAKSTELSIEYADGSTENIQENSSGGLLDRARTAEGRTICTAWYPQGHVFGQDEKKAAVQEYANRLGVVVSASSGGHRPHTASQTCGGAFIAGGTEQKNSAALTTDPGAGKTNVTHSNVAEQRAQSDSGASLRAATSTDLPAVSVATSAVHLIDASNVSARPAGVEPASFTLNAPSAPMKDTRGESTTPVAPSGASNCLSITSNGEYWGFQNRCATSVQFSYCETTDANPLTSCKRTSVSGSVAANGFSSLVSDHSVAERNVEHEFRWMACDGGAGEVVAHLDKFDPPSGRCERAIPLAE